MFSKDNEVIKIAGREFEKVPAAYFRDFHISFRGHTDIPEEAEFVLVPYTSSDDKRSFPSNASFEDAGWFVRSGVTDLNFEEDVVRPEVGSDAWQIGGKGFSARDLCVFIEHDWHFECLSVLSAHTWINRSASISEGLIARLRTQTSADMSLSSQMGLSDDLQEIYLFELAARVFAEPLSRLWYAANMLSLYYVHHDDMRLGYLWAEYKIKMRYELFALKHVEVSERNRENGRKGGLADKKEERYRVLDSLARERPREIAFASDREGVRAARRFAEAYDQEGGESLFTVNGRPLSNRWFSDWLDHFRLVIREPL